MAQKSRIMEVLKIWLQLKPMVVPFLGSSLAGIVASAIDTSIVGHLGKGELAAVAVCSAFVAIILQTILTLGMAQSILTARAIGERDIVKPSSYMWHTLYLLFALGALITFSLSAFSPQLLKLFTADESLQAIGVTYLTHSAPIFFLLPFISVFRVWLDSHKIAKVGLRATLLSTSLDAFFSWALAYGMGPLPEMGVAGSALGTVIGYSASALFLFWYCFRRGPKPLPNFHVSRDRVKEISRIAIPESVNMALDYGGGLLLVKVAAGMGTIAVASNRMTFIILMAYFTVARCFGSATQILMGHAMGKKDRTLLRRLFVDGTIFTVVLLLLLALPLVVFSDSVFALFTSERSILANSRACLAAIALSAPFIAFASTSSAYLRSQAKSSAVMYTNLLPIWLVQIPFALLCLNSGWSVGVFCLAYPLYFMSRSLGLGFYSLPRSQAVMEAAHA